MPNDSKRVGVTESEIVLAFPLSAEGKPVERTQETHAFLPIQDYGFKFLIQADFLLTASREDILDCEWSRCLRHGITLAFISALKKLNHTPELRYVWMRFLPFGLTYSLLSSIESDLRTALRMERIIWSRAKTLEKPEMLANVPCVYLDRQQRPLIGTTVDMKIYLSSKYDWVKDKATLRSLGVTEMTPSSFITKVTSFTQVSRKQYENESPEWHEDLCKAITTLPDMFWHSQIPSLPLIPLRNEQWMSAQQAGKEVFLDHDDGTPVPHGINILLVEPTAMKSAVRASLFRRLGLGPCDIQKVAHLILQKHKEGRRAISHRREAIQHLVYLYKARKTLSAVSLTDMWLSDIQNKACHGRDLYIDHPSDNLLRSLFKNNLSILRFVHPDFVSAVSGAEQAEWIDWLVSSMRLMTAPRLMENGKLSQAFKSIIANHSSTVWLKLLGDPQRNYNPRLSSDVCKELSNSQVVCTDGTLHTLGDTYLQTPELCQISQSFEKGSFWFVEVESPRDRAWEYLLGPLGVVTQIDIHFYARLLNNMKLRGSAVIAEVASIYTSMLQRSDCHLACIIFEKQALIPVVSSTQPRWLTSAQCVWKGPPGLRCRTSIESLYHGLERFFCGALGVKNATLDMVLDDLADLAGKTSKHDIQDVKSLLLAIPQCNENRSGDSKIKTLKGLELFPVQSAIVDGEISLMPCTAHFYISDRQRLRDAFVGEIPMLDFEVSAVHDLNTLIDILQLHHKLLSTTVTETCTTFGDSELDESFTKDLSGKAVALISCAFHYGSKEYEKHQDNLLDNLLRIEGWLADGIVSTLSLSYMGSTKQVNLPGNLLFEVTESKAVRICLPRDEEEAHMAYVMHLPARLIDYLDIPRDRSSIIHEILGLPNSRLKSVLDHYGVPEFKCNSSPHASRSELASIPTVSHHQVLEISIPPLTEDVSLVRQPQIPTADPQYVASNAIMKDSRSSKIRVNAQPRQLKCSKTPVESLTSMMRTLDQGKFIQGSSSKIGNAPISKHTVLQLVSSDRINQVTSSAKIYSQALPVAVTSAHRIPILDETTYMFDTATPIEPRSSKDSCIRSPKISATHLTSQDDGGLTIGFSGELFVSEYLKAIIPDFSEEHWTSNLREHARIHDDYKDIEAYDAREIADFMYADTHGHLTCMLVRAGHEVARAWLSAPPTYLIEVKATTDNCDVPFSISNFQDQLARRLIISACTIPETAYLIFRVFHVHTDPEFVIYVDPGRMLAEGGLRKESKDGFLVWPVG